MSAFIPPGSKNHHINSMLRDLSTLQSMHDTFHNVQKKGQIRPRALSARKAGEFIQGRTGEPVLNENGECNFCGKKTNPDTGAFL
jgi:hypothetical protein